MKHRYDPLLKTYNTVELLGKLQTIHTLRAVKKPCKAKQYKYMQPMFTWPIYWILISGTITIKIWKVDALDSKQAKSLSWSKNTRPQSLARFNASNTLPWKGLKLEINKRNPESDLQRIIPLYFARGKVRKPLARQVPSYRL